MHSECCVVEALEALEAGLSRRQDGNKMVFNFNGTPAYRYLHDYRYDTGTNCLREFCLTLITPVIIKIGGMDDNDCSLLAPSAAFTNLFFRSVNLAFTRATVFSMSPGAPRPTPP
jgi:hypothetical protein